MGYQKYQFSYNWSEYLNNIHKYINICNISPTSLMLSTFFLSSELTDNYNKLNQSQNNISEKNQICAGTDVDINILINSLFQELQTTKKQLLSVVNNQQSQFLQCEETDTNVKSTVYNNTQKQNTSNQLNELLECIQLMKVQFRYNQQLYVKLQQNYKEELVKNIINQNTIKSITRQLVDKETTLLQSQQQLDVQQFKIETLNLQLKQLNMNNEKQLNIQENQLLIQLKALQDQVQNKENIQELQKQFVSIQEEKTKLLQKIKSQENIISKQIQCQTQQIENQQMQQINSQDQIQLQTHVILLEKQLESQQQQIKLYQEMLDMYISDPQNHVNQQEALQNKIDLQNKQITELENNNLKLTNNVSDQEKQIGKFEEANTALVIQVEKLENQVNQLQNQQQASQQNYDQQNQSLHQQKDKIIHLAQEIENLNQQNIVLQEINNLRGDNDLNVMENYENLLQLENNILRNQLINKFE